MISEGSQIEKSQARRQARALAFPPMRSCSRLNGRLGSLPSALAYHNYANPFLRFFPADRLITFSCPISDLVQLDGIPTTVQNLATDNHVAVTVRSGSPIPSDGHNPCTPQ